jgi:hypothetical protein
MSDRDLSILRIIPAVLVIIPFVGRIEDHCEERDCMCIRWFNSEACRDYDRTKSDPHGTFQEGR